MSRWSDHCYNIDVSYSSSTRSCSSFSVWFMQFFCFTRIGRARWWRLWCLWIWSFRISFFRTLSFHSLDAALLRPFPMNTISVSRPPIPFVSDLQSQRNSIKIQLFPIHFALNPFPIHSRFRWTRCCRSLCTPWIVFGTVDLPLSFSPQIPYILPHSKTTGLSDEVCSRKQDPLRLRSPDPPLGVL